MSSKLLFKEGRIFATALTDSRILDGRFWNLRYRDHVVNLDEFVVCDFPSSVNGKFALYQFPDSYSRHQGFYGLANQRRGSASGDSLNRPETKIRARQEY